MLRHNPAPILQQASVIASPMSSETMSVARSAVMAEYNQLLSKVDDSFETSDRKAAHRSVAKEWGDWSEKISAGVTACDVDDQEFFQEIAARAQCQQGLGLLEAGDTAEAVSVMLQGTLATLRQLGL
jgi:hypothetical protein